VVPTWTENTILTGLLAIPEVGSVGDRQWGQRVSTATPPPPIHNKEFGRDSFSVEFPGVLPK
jgi:hypothetical protein